MGLIKRTVKYGVPFGFVYWTVKSGEWKPLQPNEDLEKTRPLYHELITVKSTVGPYITPYVPEIPIDKAGLAEKWNEMVKRAMSTLAGFRLSCAYKVLMKQFEAATQATTDGKSTSIGNKAEAKKEEIK